MPEPTNIIDVPIAGEVSATEADLAAKIDEQLGIKGPSIETGDELHEEDTDSTETGSEDNQEEVETADTDSDETEEVVEPPTLPEPATPSDAELFIEVEDAEGVTHKITTIDDLPVDFAPKNNRQILEIIKATDNLDKQREQRDADAQTAAQTAAIKEIETQQYTSWDKEIAELVKDKRLTNSDTDKVDKVFAHMNDVNNARIKAGNPNLVSSFEDALEKFEAQEAKAEAETLKKNGNDVAKRKAAIIGNSSASAGGEHYIYRAGSARNIDDVPV